MEEALALPDVGRRLDGGTAPAHPCLHHPPGSLEFSRGQVPGYPKDPRQARDLTAGLPSGFLRPDRGLDEEEEGLPLGTQPPGPQRPDRAVTGSRVWSGRSALESQLCHLPAVSPGESHLTLQTVSPPVRRENNAYCRKYSQDQMR